MAVAARARGSSLLRALAGTRGPPRRRGLDPSTRGPTPSTSSSTATSPRRGPPPPPSSTTTRRRLTSSRREALGLYRDILRATRLFEWPDERGVPWRESLRANARREFEEARGERDPEVVARLLIGGRDAVEQALERVADASRRMVQAEEAKRRGGA